MVVVAVVAVVMVVIVVVGLGIIFSTEHSVGMISLCSSWSEVEVVSIEGSNLSMSSMQTVLGLCLSALLDLSGFAGIYASQKEFKKETLE